MTRYPEPPNVWSEPPWCRFCRGHVPPRGRVRDRCKADRGSLTVQAWLKRVFRTRPGLVIEHRYLNDMEASERRAMTNSTVGATSRVGRPPDYNE